MNIDKLVKHGLPREYIKLLRKRGVRELNIIQKTAVEKGLFSRRNILVSSPTASGKTLVGEMALVKNIAEKNMGIYLVPLRALASEKYNEMKVLEEIGYRIGISTGDYESPADHLAKYDLVIATYERFDSLLRLRPRWLNRVKTVVIDELHIVNDPERGPIVEMIIARLLDRNIQLIGLSATIGNPDILAQWMNAELVNINYRPVKLVEGYYNRRKGLIVFKNGVVEKIEHRIGSSALNIALHSILHNIQVLVFIHNRRKTEEYAETIIEHLGIYRHLVDQKKLGELLEELKNSPSKIEREKLERLLKHGVAFHHAGLSSIARRVVEKAFRERVVRVVFATPTLAAGVNLPARRVLVSVKRYDPSLSRTINIPVFEYKQMAGRAGRPQYDEEGEAIIYDARNENEAWRYINSDPEPVESKLGSERSLRIHVLSLIASNYISSVNDLIEIFKKTLYYTVIRDLRYLINNVHGILSQLSEWNMVEIVGEKLYSTELGRITSITYLDPLTVHRYLKDLVEKPGELYYLHKITYTPDYLRSKPYISDRIVELYEDEALMLADEDIIPRPPTREYEYYMWLQSYVHARILHEWINEYDEDTIIREYGIGPGDLYSMRDTASWIAGSLSRVEKIMGNIERSSDLEKLSIRIEYGVKEDALELVKLEGIGRARARILITNGIRSLEELARTPDDVLEKLPSFGPRIVKSIKEQLRILGYI